MRLVILPIAVVLRSGCSRFGPHHEEFVIKVDSVSVPGAVSGGAAFEAKFYGTIGTSGCYQFKEFRVTRQAGVASVTVVGVHHEPTGTMCTANLPQLDGRALMIEPPLTDPFVLKVNQPSAGVLEKTIRVE